MRVFIRRFARARVDRSTLVTYCAVHRESSDTNQLSWKVEIGVEVMEFKGLYVATAQGNNSPGYRS